MPGAPPSLPARGRPLAILLTTPAALAAGDQGGKTLGQATSALGAAHCTLGSVTKAKAKHGHKPDVLIVKSSTAGTGAHPASGKVDLKLGPKPKPKKHHH